MPGKFGRRFTVSEAAAYLELSVGQVYRLTHQNRIRCLRTDGRVLERQHKGQRIRYVKSGRIFFFERHLDEWIDAHLSGGTARRPVTRAPAAPTSELAHVMPATLRFAR